MFCFFLFCIFDENHDFSIPFIIERFTRLKLLFKIGEDFNICRVLKKNLSIHRTKIIYILGKKSTSSNLHCKPSSSVYMQFYLTHRTRYRCLAKNICKLLLGPSNTINIQLRIYAHLYWAHQTNQYLAKNICTLLLGPLGHTLMSNQEYMHTFNGSIGHTFRGAVRRTVYFVFFVKASGEKQLINIISAR